MIFLYLTIAVLATGFCIALVGFFRYRTKYAETLDELQKAQAKNQQYERVVEKAARRIKTRWSNSTPNVREARDSLAA